METMGYPEVKKNFRESARNSHESAVSDFRSRSVLQFGKNSFILRTTERDGKSDIGQEAMILQHIFSVRSVLHV